MKFSVATLFAFLGSPLLALAQSGANPFTIPSNFSVTAGSPVTLTWNPTTSGTVSLILRSGASSDLDAGATIQSGLQNTGSYTWQVPSSITRGSDYTVEIVSDSDSSQVNYSHYFVIDSTNTVASVTGGSSSAVFSSVTLGAPSSSLSLSSGNATITGTASVTTLTGTRGSSSGSSSATTTGSSSHSATTSSDGASFITSSTSHAGGPRATAMAGMLGFVALGALAL